MIKPFDELEFTDDFLFSKIMKDKSLCKELIQILLEIEVDKIEFINTQTSINEDYFGRGIRFDVYIKDSNRVFDVEMQTTDDGNLPLRARYYQAMMDIDNLRKGQDYSVLKESYVIFICTFDPFGKKLPTYYFETTCKNYSDLKLNDKVYKVFYNSNAFLKSKNPKIRAFLQFIENRNSTSAFTEKLKKAVYTAKRNEPWRVNYMTLQMKMNEAKTMGKTEGIQQNKLETAKIMLTKNYAIKEIAEITGLQQSQIQALQ